MISVALGYIALQASLNKASKVTTAASNRLACFIQQRRYRLNLQNYEYLVVALRATGSLLYSSGALLSLKEGSLCLGLYLSGILLIVLSNTYSTIGSSCLLFALALSGSYTCYMLVLYESVSGIKGSRGKTPRKRALTRVGVILSILLVSLPILLVPASAL